MERSIAFFDRVLFDCPVIQDIGSAGRLILCLTNIGKQDDQINQLKSFISSSSESDLNLYAVAQSSETLLSLAKELQALEIIERHSSIEGDATARKEVELRKEIISSQLIEQLTNSFSHATWLCDGFERSINGMREFTSMVSDICDKRFNAAPVINNELFNRERLSSNISRARRVLMLSMVNHLQEERLGIEGYPPEAMLYLSMLKATKMHRVNKTTGKYYFDTNDCNRAYKPLWSLTREFFISNERPTLAELYELWSKPPFGLKSGIKPILALVYFLANAHELSVYINGVIQPEFNEEVLEHWHNDPREVSFRYVESSTEKNELLLKLSGRLNTFTGVNCDSTSLSVARAIVRIVLTCPKWALTTSNLTDLTKEFRTTVVKAWDPLALLFQDLPKIFQTENVDVLVSKTLDALEEIQSVTPQMLQRVRLHLYKAIDHDGELLELNTRAKLIQNTAGQMQLEAFISRMSAFDGSDALTEGVISLAVAKNRLQWTDRDIEQAINKISDWALSFRHLEGMALLRNRENSRRIIGMVVGGESGEAHDIVDLPTKYNKILEDTNQQLATVLKSLPRDVALAALIDQSISLLREK